MSFTGRIPSTGWVRSLLGRGRMSQKSITSFFGKSASKKVEGWEKCEGVEKDAKTKKDTAASGNANHGAKKSQDDIKQYGVEEAEKENSKNGANVQGSVAAAASNGGPLPLDAEGVPPLRKTAVNPVFKRKSRSVEGSRTAENPNHKSTEKEKKNQECETPLETSAEPLTANRMDNLAPEILITIFGFLPFNDLKSAMLVCRFVLQSYP